MLHNTLSILVLYSPLMFNPLLQSLENGENVTHMRHIYCVLRAALYYQVREYIAYRICTALPPCVCSPFVLSFLFFPYYILGGDLCGCSCCGEEEVRLSFETRTATVRAAVPRKRTKEERKNFLLNCIVFSRQPQVITALLFSSC